MFKIAFASALLVITSGTLAQTGNTDAPELARIQSEYSDVLALRGTAKAELLAIARVLRAKPEMAIDRTKAAGEYCFKSSESTMFTTRRSPSPQWKTWSTSSIPHSYSQPALTPSDCQGCQLWARWNPANGTSFRVGSSILTISMTSLRQRSLLPST